MSRSFSELLGQISRKAAHSGDIGAGDLGKMKCTVESLLQRHHQGLMTRSVRSAMPPTGTRCADACSNFLEECRVRAMAWSKMTEGRTMGTCSGWWLPSSRLVVIASPQRISLPLQQCCH